jgi:hypothetical protein
LYNYYNYSRTLKGKRGYGLKKRVTKEGDETLRVHPSCKLLGASYIHKGNFNKRLMGIPLLPYYYYYYYY